MPMLPDDTHDGAGDQSRHGGHRDEADRTRVRGHGSAPRAGDDVKDPGDQQHDCHGGGGLHPFFCMMNTKR